MNFGDESMGTERYHPLVAVDLRDACQHYDAITPTLGNRFRMNVQTKIQTIVPIRCRIPRRKRHFVNNQKRMAESAAIFVGHWSIACIYGVRHAASNRKTWFDRTMPAIDG